MRFVATCAQPCITNPCSPAFCPTHMRTIGRHRAYLEYGFYPRLLASANMSTQSPPKTQNGPPRGAVRSSLEAADSAEGVLVSGLTLSCGASPYTARSLSTLVYHVPKKLCALHMPAAKQPPPGKSTAGCPSKTHSFACLAHHDMSIACKRTRNEEL